MPKKRNRRSLPHAKFLIRHEKELTNYWYELASFVYAERWWESVPKAQWPKLITDYPGDNQRPFNRIRLSPGGFIACRPGAEQAASLTTLVNLITIFETYIYDATQRAVFLSPDVLSKSDVPFKASDLAANVSRTDFRAWFAHRIADKYCRNKAHRELVNSLAVLVKSGIKTELAVEIDEWSRWVLVRNAIVHLGGEVTADLSSSWPARFTRVGEPIHLSPTDITQVAHLSRTLVKALDERLLTTIVKHADNVLLVQEIFVRHGVDSPSQLVVHVNSILNGGISKGAVERALAAQRRSPQPSTGFTFLEEMVWVT